MTPLALFAYNRPEAFRRTLEALAENSEALETPVYIFVDGPRSPADAPKVAQTCRVAREARGFASVTLRFSEQNKGLADSIISGVTEVLEGADAVIVLEDDLRVHPSFLSYMNAALQEYRDKPSVFSVCGYTNRIRIPAGYPYDAHFCTRSSSWGWGTWKDRWEKVDWAPTRSELFRHWFGFRRWGGSDCSKMLLGCLRGRNHSWAIRFCFAEYLTGGLSLFPNRSLVDNSGSFSGDGTNCRKFSRFKFEWEPTERRRFRFPPEGLTDSRIIRRSLWYHSLPLRLYSRIMYLFYD